MRTNFVSRIGYNDLKYSTRTPNGEKPCPIYIRWKNMLARCYSKDCQALRPTYGGCYVSDNFLEYSYFHDWYLNQIGSKNPKANMDKDLILKGNKLYSEDTCLLLPYELNNQLIKRANDRGSLPIGVTWNKRERVYKAQLNIDGKRKCVARSDCPIEAFKVYKIEKENHLKHLADKYRCEIDIRAYNALMNYKVEITD